MLRLIESGRPLNGWTLRKTLELHADYDSAVEYLTKVRRCWWRDAGGGYAGGGMVGRDSIDIA